MKGFYIIAAGVVALLGATPFMFLDAKDSGQYAGLIARCENHSAAVKSVDPVTCGDTTSSRFQANVFEGLYAYHFLKRPIHSNVIPQLAADAPQISKDFLTYTIKLRQDVLYHNNPCFGRDDQGNPKTRKMKAQDFVTTFKRVADYHVNTGLAWAFTTRIKGLKEYRKKTKTYKPGDFSRYNLDVEGVKALDDYTLQITLDEPYPQFNYVLAMHVYAPIPREAIDYWLGTESNGKGGRKPIPIDQRSTEFRKAEQLVGTGPYVWKIFKEKYQIIQERNPNYRDDFYPSEGEPGDREVGLFADAGKKAPFIDVLQSDFSAETSGLWLLFLAKERDTARIPPDNFDAIIDTDRELTDKWRKKGIYLRTYTSPAVYWIVFNMEDKVVGASKSLRQALCASFDVESYIKVLQNGKAKRAVNILPSTFKGWKEAGSGPYYKLDMELARKKLARAKEELRQAGLLKDGEIPPLTMDIGGQRKYHRDMGQFFQQQFDKLGTKLECNYNDWNTQQGKVNNKNVQMYMMGWHADYPDAENFLQLYYGPNIDKQTNNSNYHNPAFDKLYEKVRVMPDTPERTKLYAEMVNIISEDCPALMLTEPTSFVLIYDWVKNFKPHPIGYGYDKYRRIDTTQRNKSTGRKD